MLTLGGDAHVTANIAESQGVGADVGAGGGIYQAGGVVQLDGGGRVGERQHRGRRRRRGLCDLLFLRRVPGGVFYLRQGAVQGNTALFWGGGISSREGKVFMTGGAVAQNRVLTKEERSAPPPLPRACRPTPIPPPALFTGAAASPPKRRPALAAAVP